MSKLSITSTDFKEGEEIPKECGYKHGNEKPALDFGFGENEPFAWAMIMDDPDAMAAVGKVWVHWLEYGNTSDEHITDGKNDFGEIGYGGPAPPDRQHTYVFKLYELDTDLDLKEGFSKQELEDAMKGHVIAEAKLTGTFPP
ncbi:MAG: YbhB/YbcL family Raf kinase inhibitor-like protein [Candidatus Nitrosopelagicus sp.]|nr:YbhB/YbcL family Raf kinase inhibitor-like protein [Candidatus Nitrosopelagicus sp.]